MKRERWHAQRDGEGATCLRLRRYAPRNDSILQGRLPRPVNGSRNDSVKRLPRRYARDDNFFLSPSDLKSGSADDFHYHVEFELPA